MKVLWCVYSCDSCLIMMNLRKLVCSPRSELISIDSRHSYHFNRCTRRLLIHLLCILYNQQRFLFDYSHSICLNRNHAFGLRMRKTHIGAKQQNRSEWKKEKKNTRKNSFQRGNFSHDLRRERLKTNGKRRKKKSYKSTSNHIQNVNKILYRFFFSSLGRVSLPFLLHTSHSVCECVSCCCVTM